MLNAPGGDQCLFDKQSSYCFSVPRVAAQRGDVVSFSDFGAAVASAALRGDLEMCVPRQGQSDARICTPYHSVLLWMDGQEAMEAFDFAFGSMRKYDLDVLRTLTLTSKVFQVFLPSHKSGRASCG